MDGRDGPTEREGWLGPFLEALADAGQAGLVVDERGRVLLANTPARDLFGLGEGTPELDLAERILPAPRGAPGAPAAWEEVQACLQAGGTCLLRRGLPGEEVAVSARFGILPVQWEGEPQSLLVLSEGNEEHAERAGAAACLDLIGRGRGKPAREILPEIVAVAARLSGSSAGAFLQLREGRLVRIAQWDRERGGSVIEMAGRHWAEGLFDQAGPCRSNDSAHVIARLFEGQGPFVREALVPVNRGGRTLGLLVVGSKPEAYSSLDVQILESFLEGAWETYRLASEVEGLARACPAVLDALEEAVFLLDGDSRVVHANAAALELLGRPMGEIVGLACWEAIPDCVDIVPGCPVARCRATGGRQRAERRLAGRDYLVTAHPVEDGAGKVQVVLTLREVARAACDDEALRIERDELRRYLDVAGTMFLVLDGEGRILFVNRKAAEIFGKARLELEGRTTMDDFLPRGPQEAFRSATREVLAQRGPSVRFLEGDLVVGPRRYWIRWTIAPLDRGGRTLGRVVVSGEDATERRALEAQVEVAQRMEAVGHLAAGVAHDFNNYLSVINGLAEVLLEGLEGPDPMRQDLEAIRSAGLKAADLTRQLLALGRRQVLRPVMVDLNELLQRMEAVLRRALPEHVELEFVLDPGLGLTRVDPVQMEQVVLNLVLNARDAMPEGGRLLLETQHVELDVEYAEFHPDVWPGEYVLLSVTDTGVGMPPEVRSRVFEPFFTTKEKGTGLGLSTAYGIVRQSGGTIWVYSEPGRGTTFKVYLPRFRGEADALPTHAEALGDLRGSETVLVVEDDPAVRSLLVRMLSSAGYRVLEAADGLEAVFQLEAAEGRVDLLLTDLVLPHLSGRELVAELRGRFPGLDVLYVSGYAENGVFRQGLIEETFHFLAKPFTRKELLAAVRRALGSRRS